MHKLIYIHIYNTYKA